MEQIILFITLLAALVLFIGGWLRYDVVALLTLLVVTITGIVPGNEAFAGFGHPAVITVAAVLIIGRGLLNAGVVSVISRWIGRVGEKTTIQVGVLTAMVTFSSAFMNNVGALALLMPVAIRMARRQRKSPSVLLMPLAFGSLLGGLITLIGTPPNIIIATFRSQAAGIPFRMFDFTPVGLSVAVAGGIFLALVGWRLIPQRRGQGSTEDLFQIEDYISEVRVPAESPLVDKPLRDLNSGAEVEVVVVALVRGKRHISAPSSFETLRADDVLIIEAAPDDLKELVDVAQLELVGSSAEGQAILGGGDISVIEAVVTPDAPILYRSARNLNMRWRYGINLLAVARQGTRLTTRLREIRFQPGDILLLQGRTDTFPEVLSELGCLPLQARELQIGKPRRLLLALAIFAAALVAASTGLLPIQIALVAAAVTMVMARILSLKEAYASIDWPVIVLLGAMIPVAGALETTGGAQSIASLLLQIGQQVPPVVTLGMVMVATMCLSDLINNATTAVLMAPIALRVAQGLGVSADPFLMAVAIGASSAFLTPIGHQSNTLVMGPGGYRFGDYWRVGLPLEILIVVVGLPLIVLVWGL
ncbi:MAG TPA: SLC13 family permease [Spirillospora sp.]|nr:SLC13 family permease [Spirillospora sp.]